MSIEKTKGKKDGNGDHVYITWSDLPDPLLLHIFSYLNVEELAATSKTCFNWRRIASDEYLWQTHTRIRWGVKHTAKSDVNWRSEYQRLDQRAPTKESEVLRLHNDEVFDVAFSNSGEYFVTVGKDCLILLWRLGFPTRLASSVDTKKTMNWLYTAYSCFNEDDTRLLVRGMKEQGPREEGRYADRRLGCVAVFSVPDMILYMVVLADPPGFNAAWLTPSVIATGYLLLDQSGTMKIKAFKVPSKPAVTTKRGKVSDHVDAKVLYTFQGRFQQSFSVMVADVQSSNNSVGDIAYDHSKSPLVSNLPKDTYDGSFRERKKIKLEDPGTNKDDIDMKQSENGIESKKRTSGGGDIVENQTDRPRSNKSSCTQSYFKEKLLIFAAGGLQNCIYIHRIKDSKLNFKEGGDEISEDDQVDEVDHVLNVGWNDITSLRLSGDKRLLFFNFRSFRPPQHYVSNNMPRQFSPDDSDQERVILDECNYTAEQQIGVVDLTTMSVNLDLNYTDHTNNTRTVAWYLGLDACGEFISSGSADETAYLWDRRHQVLVAKLPHSEGVVNCASFCPRDYQCLVTVGDDQTVRVWRSKESVRKLRIENS